MTFSEFEAFAQRVFAEIPPEFRDGVDGLEVSRATVAHPSLPEVFTLGECKSEYFPSEFGGAGEVRSIVALYYGSFLELSRREDEWDWEGEIWETVTHEVRHHLESLALEDALEVQDYAEGENFARREGEAFEPFFYRSGTPLGEDAYEVDGDVFLERSVDPAAVRAEPGIHAEWRGRGIRVRAPRPLGDVHFVRVAGAGEDGPGELFLVLVRRRSAWEWVRGLLAPAPLRVLCTDGEAERGEPGP